MNKVESEYCKDCNWKVECKNGCISCPKALYGNRIEKMPKEKTDVAVDPYDMKYIRGGKPGCNSIKTESNIMTREEAKQIFLDRGFVNGIFDGNKWRESVIVISKWLEQKKPCEDSVSRQTVLSKFKEVCFSEEWAQFRIDYGSNGQRDFLIKYIEQLPPVTQQPCEEREQGKCPFYAN